jgi:hypothetical protein
VLGARCTGALLAARAPAEGRSREPSAATRSAQRVAHTEARPLPTAREPRAALATSGLLAPLSPLSPLTSPRSPISRLPLLHPISRLPLLHSGRSPLLPSGVPPSEGEKIAGNAPPTLPPSGSQRREGPEIASATSPLERLSQGRGNAEHTHLFTCSHSLAHWFT